MSIVQHIDQSMAVICLFEAALQAQEDSVLSPAVRSCTGVPVSLHRSRRWLDLSAFAPMDAQLFGMLYLDNVDERERVVALSLRSTDNTRLHTLEVPRDFFIVEDVVETRRSTAAERVAMLMEAVSETLGRANSRKSTQGRERSDVSS